MVGDQTDKQLKELYEKHNQTLGHFDSGTHYMQVSLAKKAVEGQLNGDADQ